MASLVLWVSAAAASATVAAWPLAGRVGVEVVVWLQSVLPPPPGRLRREHRRRCCSVHVLLVRTHWKRMPTERKRTVGERKRQSSADGGAGGDFGFLGRYYCYCWRVNRTNLSRRRWGRHPMAMKMLLLLRLMMWMTTVMMAVVEREEWSDQAYLKMLWTRMMMISVSCCFRRHHHHRRRRAVGSDSDSEEREIIIFVCSVAAVDSGSAAASVVAGRSCPSTGTWLSSPMVSISEMNT